MSRGDFWQPLIAPEARKERSGKSFSASHIGPRADCPFHRPAFFRPGRNTRRNHALPPLHQVLIALRFYASGSFLQVIGDTFGVDKSTVSRVITNVSRALIMKQPHFIKWPSTNDECATIKNEFYLRGGFPCVIGFVDGTHVRLQAPSQHKNNYVNRKGFHSINVQGVCNHEGE